MATQGLYSPPSRNYPQELPDYWRFEDGTVRTDLRDISNTELKKLGWNGPIVMPPFEGTSYFTHNFTWNRDTLSFDATEVDEYEKRRRVNYQMFWDRLLDTGAYNTIKLVATQSLEANTIATEFIALISDAKAGHPNVNKIQQVLLEVVGGIPFSEAELAEIQQIFTESGMFAVYSLTA